MWRVPTIDVLDRAEAAVLADVHVIPRVMPNATVNEASMLNSEFSRVRLTP